MKRHPDLIMKTDRLIARRITQEIAAATSIAAQKKVNSIATMNRMPGVKMFATKTMRMRTNDTRTTSQNKY